MKSHANTPYVYLCTSAVKKFWGVNDRGRNEIKNWSRTNPSTIKHNLLENDINSHICVLCGSCLKCLWMKARYLNNIVTGEQILILAVLYIYIYEFPQ